LTGSQLPTDRIRLTVYRVVVVIAFLALVAQLWRLQALRGDYYQQAADVNRFRLEQIPAQRGVIYDRRGYILARNMPELVVSVIPAYLPEDPLERRALLTKLAELIDVPFTSPSPSRAPHGVLQPDIEPAPEPAASVLDIMQEAEAAPYRPVVLKSGVPRDVAMILEEEHLDWPGVLVQSKSVRDYLYGPLVAHVLGYVGPIPEEQVETYESQGYDPSLDQVGLTGVEYSFEKDLSGQDGQKLIEADINGREVQVVGQPQPAVPGNSLRLTLDLDLQRFIEETLAKSLETNHKQQGVVVATNPQTGEILAMVSLPSYDNNEFSGGISPEALKALQEDPNHPLLNHAISGQYPPGSTFKIIVASAGLEEQIITANTPLHCGGILWLPNRFYPEDPSLAQPFYCWLYHSGGGGHGSLNVVTALTVSCDIFFYQVAGGYRNQFAGLGEERLAYYAKLFGLGGWTGVDLPGEAPGLIPTSKWKRLNYSESWVTGDTYNMAIGQGFDLATPLQMVTAASAIANGGTVYRPQIVREVVDGDGNVVKAFAPDIIRQLPVSPENIELVRKGMRGAVASGGGTAWAMKVPGVEVAGKTGSAEYVVDENKDGLPDRTKAGTFPTHAWFITFAPYENPEIALVVFVYGGGEGSAVSVPIASDILNYYFSRDLEESQP
jgi:penicillin-binding protein 2